MYELLVMLPFLVQSDAAEADLAGILKQLVRPFPAVQSKPIGLLPPKSGPPGSMGNESYT